MNAYALTGGPVPVNLPQEVAVIRWGLDDHRGPEETIVEDMDFFTLKRLSSIVDGYVRELTLKDETPDALGELTIDPARSARGGKPRDAARDVHRRVAADAAGRRASDRHPVHGRPGQGAARGSGRRRLCLDRVVEPGQARFEPIKVPLAGLHGGFVVERPTPAYRLIGPALQPGDTITLTYGDRSEGSRGLKVQTFTTDASGVRGLRRSRRQGPLLHAALAERRGRRRTGALGVGAGAVGGRSR